MDFYRLIAMLENELFSNETKDGTFITIGLSLKRLYVWVLVPLQKLRLLHILLGATKDVRGGAMLSVLNQYLDHGDPFIQEFILKLLPKVSYSSKFTIRSRSPSLICFTVGFDAVNYATPFRNSVSPRMLVTMIFGDPSMLFEWT